MASKPYRTAAKAQYKLERTGADTPIVTASTAVKLCADFRVAYIATTSTIILGYNIEILGCAI